MSDIKQSSLDLIGGTPLLQLNNYAKMKVWTQSRLSSFMI